MSDPSAYVPQPGRPPKPEHRIQHGTDAGHAWHRRQGEPPCDQCRKGHAKSMREWRRKRRKERMIVRDIMSGGQGLKGRITGAEADEILRALKKEFDAL